MARLRAAGDGLGRLSLRKVASRRSHALGRVACAPGRPAFETLENRQYLAGQLLAQPSAGSLSFAATMVPLNVGVMAADAGLSASSAAVATPRASTTPTITALNPTSGPPAGGTVVTITGSNFTGATAVEFGTVAATNVTVVSDTEITATTPAEAAGTVDVTVTTPTGTSATSPADQFTFGSSMTMGPTVTAVSPTSGPPAGGTVVTITGTNFTGATAVKFGAIAAANITVVSATEITATTPAEAAGTVDVTVTAPTGTSATSPADQFTFGSVMTTAPTVTSVTPYHGPPAGGTTVTITGTNFTGATAVKFGTLAATSFTVVSATEITAITPAEAVGNVDVTVTTANGTSATSTGDVFVFGTSPTTLTLGATLPYGATDFVENAAGTTVYATVPSLGEVVFINETTLAVSQTVHVGTKPTGLALSADGSTLYVADNSANAIEVVNATTGVVGTPLTLPGGDFPTDVQVGTEGRLFVLVSGQVLQINASTGASAGASFATPGGDIRITPDGDTLLAADYGLSPSSVAAFNVSGATATQLYSIEGGTNGEDLEVSPDGSTFTLASGGGSGGGSGGAYADDLFAVSDGTAHSNAPVGAYPIAFAFSQDETVGYAGQASQDPAIKIYSLSKDASGVLNFGSQLGTLTTTDPVTKMYSSRNGDLFVGEGTLTEIFANPTSSGGGGGGGGTGGTSTIALHVGAGAKLYEGHSTLDKTDAFFTDSTGTGPYTATVNYGDGTGLKTVPYNANDQLTLVHAYNGHVSQTYVVTVTVYTRTSASQHSFDVTVVNDAPHDLVVKSVSRAAATTSTPFLARATFLDNGAGNGDFYRVYFNYGDGTKVIAVTTQHNTFGVGHQYTHPGHYKLLITVIDDGGSQTTFSQVINVFAPTPAESK